MDSIGDVLYTVVQAGDPVGVPAKGGVMTRPAPEPGVLFQVADGPPLYVPASTMELLGRLLGETRRGRKR